jgi:hypothetical protein
MPFCNLVKKAHFQELLTVYDLIFIEDSRDEKKAREKVMFVFKSFINSFFS